MKRRLIVLGLAATPVAPQEERVPTDEWKLNKFAEAYNTFLELLRRDVIDLKAWRRVKKAWEGLMR